MATKAVRKKASVGNHVIARTLRAYNRSVRVYFAEENAVLFAWLVDKKKAHVFASRKEALTFTKKYHAWRVQTGRDVATMVVEPA